MIVRPGSRTSFPGRRVIFTASAMLTFGALPKFLLGALAVLISDELGLRAAQLGAAVSLFVVISATTSAHAGRIVERVGPHRATVMVAGLSGVSLAGIALLTSTYLHLLGWLVVGGAANSLAHPAAALAIASGVSPARRGLAFGINKSAVPTATLLGGVAVPVFGLTVGWRWAYAAAALTAALLAFAAPRVARRPVGASREGHAGKVTSGMRTLIMLSIGMGLASAAANALTAFYVLSAVEFAVPLGAAGLWFAAGSISSIVVRLWVGWRADRREGGNLAAVAWLLAAGACGFALLGHAGNPVVLGLGTILAFGAGWGWPGLFHLSVARQNPDAPAAATGIIQTGAFVGAALGPLLFGLIVERVSYPGAWWAVAAVVLAAAGFMRAGRQAVRKERSQQRPVGGALAHGS